MPLRLGQPVLMTSPLALPQHPVSPLGFGRCFHIIDIENIAGRADGALYGAAADRYRAAVRLSRRDLAIVGCDKSGALAAARALPHCRLVVGYGPDGADNALVAAIDERVLHERFTTLVIGSGDHHFAVLAARAKAAGLTTVAVIGRGKLSRALAHRVDAVIYLDRDEAVAEVRELTGPGQVAA